MGKLIKTGYWGITSKKNGIAEVELVPSDPEIDIIKIAPKKKGESRRPSPARLAKKGVGRAYGQNS